MERQVVLGAGGTVGLGSRSSEGGGSEEKVSSCPIEVYSRKQVTGKWNPRIGFFMTRSSNFCRMPHSLSIDGRAIAWNKAMEVMTGVPKESMLGRGD